MSAIPTAPLPADLMVAVCVSPGKACSQSLLMLARVLPAGIFELLSAAPWATALGYLPAEMSGKFLRELMQLEKPAAGEIIASLLGGLDSPPLDVTLRCKDRQRKSFRLHHRFDPYDGATFVLADELVEERHETLGACS